VGGGKVYHHMPGFISLFQKHLQLELAAIRKTADLSREDAAISAPVI
jgi:hypothetical protein